MMTNTLDPGYAEAAARRTASGQGARSRASGLRLAVVVAAVLAGLILVAAAGQARRSAPAQAKARAELVDQVRKRTDQVGALAHQVAALSAQLAGLRSAGLGGSPGGRSLAASLAALQGAAGTTSVSGPGVRVTLSDAPVATTEPAGAGQVRDSDLQRIVNALWAAGAEAVGINGQRVTALTSIRAAGDAIVVDFRPVDPPYVLTAIGSPDTLQSTFESSDAAAAMRTYSQAYGLGFTVKGEATATLPAAALPALYVARPSRPTRSPGGTP